MNALCLCLYVVTYVCTCMCDRNAPWEASRRCKRPQDGSRGVQMVSMRLQELTKIMQDGSQRDAKMDYMVHKMTQHVQDGLRGT